MKAFSMRKISVWIVASVLALSMIATRAAADDGHDDKDKDKDFHFQPGSIVVSGTVYEGDADTVIVNQVMPPGCLNTGTLKAPNAASIVLPFLTADQPPTTTTVTGIQCGYSSVAIIP